jgi:hypothetical protein
MGGEIARCRAAAAPKFAPKFGHEFGHELRSGGRKMTHAWSVLLIDPRRVRLARRGGAAAFHVAFVVATIGLSLVVATGLAVLVMALLAVLLGRSPGTRRSLRLLGGPVLC